MNRIFSIVLAALVLLSGSLAFAQSRPSQPPLDAERRAQLEAGEIIVETERGRLNHGDVYGLVCADEDSVWEIITDFNNMTTWFPDVEESEMLSRTETSLRGRGVTHMPFPFPDRRWITETHGSRESIGGRDSYIARYEYEQGSGNMDEMHGYWLVQQYNEECTLVRYVIDADLGVPLPAAVLNWAARRMLPGIIEGLRERHAALH